MVADIKLENAQRGSGSCFCHRAQTLALVICQTSRSGQLVGETVKQFGRLDIRSNAGLCCRALDGLIWRSFRQWSTSTDRLLSRGQTAVTVMKEQRSGSIVQISKSGKRAASRTCLCRQQAWRDRLTQALRWRWQNLSALDCCPCNLLDSPPERFPLHAESGHSGEAVRRNNRPGGSVLHRSKVIRFPAPLDTRPAGVNDVGGDALICKQMKARNRCNLCRLWLAGKLVAYFSTKRGVREILSGWLLPR